MTDKIRIPESTLKLFRTQLGEKRARLDQINTKLGQFDEAVPKMVDAAKGKFTGLKADLEAALQEQGKKIQGDLDKKLSRIKVKSDKLHKERGKLEGRIEHLEELLGEEPVVEKDALPEEGEESYDQDEVVELKPEAASKKVVDEEADEIDLDTLLEDE